MTQTKLTTLEIEVATLFALASSDCCGSFDDNENISYLNAKDLAKDTGYDMNKIGGIMTALINKDLIQDTHDSARGSRYNDFVGCPCVYLQFDELKHLHTDNIDYA